MKKLLPFLLIGTLGCLQAKAQVNDVSGIEEKKEQWYQADLVVFLNESSMNGSEKWPEITTQLLPGNIVELKSFDISAQVEPVQDWLNTEAQVTEAPDITREAYVELPFQKQLLQKQGNSLERSKGYRVLKRQSWLLSVREGEETPAVVVRQTETESQHPFQLQGTVSVSSGRFLHVDLDLWYRELAQEILNSNAQQAEVDSMDLVETSEGQTEELEVVKPVQDVIGKDQLLYSPNGKPMKVTRNFPLKQSRKIQRTEQTQYLDTPVIGALFKLTPYKHPDDKNLLELLPED